MKKIKLTMLFLIGFSALMFATAVIINTSVFDEELLPEVLAIKNIKAVPFSDNNALPALIAINGPANQPLSTATAAIKNILNEKITRSGIDYLSDDEYQKHVGNGHRGDWINAYEFCNTRRNSSCLASIYSEVQKSPIANLDLVQQLARYQELIKMTEFSDFTQHDVYAPFPAYGPTLSLKKMFLADAFINHDHAIFIEKVKQDMRFWRMVLQNSHLMITKMVAVASFYDSLNGISAAIRTSDFDSELLKELEQFLVPLNQTESDISLSLDYEFKWGIDMISAVEEEEASGMSDWINFFQPNATHNTNYRRTNLVMKSVSALDAAGFYQYLHSEQKTKDFEPPFSWTPSAMYNPVGKIMVGVGAPAYTDYIGRIHDLNGMISLLQLQIELALNPELPAQQVINQSQWVNPYTLKPMSYDAGAKRIYFDCMDKTSSCELLL